MAKLELKLPKTQPSPPPAEPEPAAQLEPPPAAPEPQPIPEGRLDPILEEAVKSQPIQPEPEPEPQPKTAPAQPAQAQPAPRFPVWGALVGVAALALAAFGIKGATSGSSPTAPAQQPAVTQLPPIRRPNNW